MLRWLVLIIVVLLAGGIGYLATGGTYHASSTAKRVAQESVETNAYFEFKAKAPAKNKVIAFYPGAFVESKAYGVWAENLAKQGYSVYLLKTPLSFSLIDQNAADAVKKANPAKQLIIGGHSLGGVVASGYAGRHRSVAGLFLLASYPQEKDKLNKLSLPVLSLTASNDKVLNQEKYQSAKKWLPVSTVYKNIAGGNHGGFGSYGQQKGDGIATISNAKQQTEIAKLVADWLGSF
jgi:alpha-beta hydrolase superfamily lysophospholipase